MQTTGCQTCSFSIYIEKKTLWIIPKEFLSKEFLSQFKTGEDVDAFLRELHTKVYEQMLDAEMDNHFGFFRRKSEPVKEKFVQILPPKKWRV